MKFLLIFLVGIIFTLAFGVFLYWWFNGNEPLP